MLLSRIAPLSALLVLSISTVTGCAVKTDDEDAALTSSELVEPSTFETITLSTQLEAPSGCDIQTILTISPPRADLSRFAHLHEEVTGGCRMYVDPDPREYVLSFTGTSCGSMTYSASKTRDGGDRQITMIDHRTRMCADLVQANVIVTETTNVEGEEGGKNTRTFYSMDGRVRFQPPEP